MGKNLGTLALIIFFFLPTTLQARPIASTDVVKIFSREVGTQLWREGSGLLVTDMKEAHLLTSFHVAYSSPDNKFEAYIQLNGKKMPINWMSSEWAKGLSLFNVPNLPATNLLSLSDLEPSANQSGKVLAMGFPHGQEQLYEVEGNLEGLKKSSLFFDLPELLDISSLDSELGMSGGALVSQSGEFLGILSHQKMSDDATHTLAIPAAAAKAWLMEVFAGSFQPRFLLETQNLDQVELVLHGSDWTLYAEPGFNGGGARIYLRFIKERNELKKIPELSRMMEVLHKEGLKQRASLKPEEPFLLNSFFKLAGFRRNYILNSPLDVYIPGNGVEFLRYFLNSNDDLFFINSGFISNYLEGIWGNYFLSWESERPYYYKHLGSSIHHVIDRLAEYERNRYLRLYGLDCFFAIFRPEEIEKMFFQPPLDVRWKELEENSPFLFSKFHDPILKAISHLKRAGFVYSK